jgi:hypothetical protein
MNSIGLAIAVPVVAAALALGGCGGAGTENKTAPEPAADSSQNRELLNAVKEPLDRAHEVEDIAAGRKGQLDEDIKKSE